MERKTVITYVAIVVLGIGLMVGVVLFLRARNAPLSQTIFPAVSGGSGNAVTAPPVKAGSVRPFVPYSQYPVSPPYKAGDPVPEQAPVSSSSQTSLPNPLQP